MYQIIEYQIIEKNRRIVSFLTVFLLTFTFAVGIVICPQAVKAENKNILITEYTLDDTINIRSGPGTDYEVIATLSKGTVLAVYQIRRGWGKVCVGQSIGWVNLEYAHVSEEKKDEDTASAESDSQPASDSQTASDSQSASDSSGTAKEYEPGTALSLNDSDRMSAAYEKIKDQSSGSSYYIVVDCTANELYIFSGSAGHWSPYALWSCCSGKAGHETVKGTFTTSSKGYSFGEPSYSCYYYTQFAPSYLFHSILYEAGTFNVKDDTMGQAVSNGCIRLTLEHAKWIYDTIPQGTCVLIY